jgi:hypothetical protein
MILPFVGKAEKTHAEEPVSPDQPRTASAKATEIAVKEASGLGHRTGIPPLQAHGNFGAIAPTAASAALRAVLRPSESRQADTPGPATRRPALPLLTPGG